MYPAKAIRLQSLGISASLYQEYRLYHIIYTNQSRPKKPMFIDLLAARLDSVCRNSAKAWSQAIKSTPNRRSGDTPLGCIHSTRISDMISRLQQYCFELTVSPYCNIKPIVCRHSRRTSRTTSVCRLISICSRIPWGLIIHVIERLFSISK